MSDGGKGDTQRPRSISNEEYNSRWDAIFGKSTPVAPPETNVEEDLPDVE